VKPHGGEAVAKALAFAWAHSGHRCMGCQSESEAEAEAEAEAERERVCGAERERERVWRGRHLCLECVHVGCFALNGSSATLEQQHARSHAAATQHCLSLHLEHMRVYSHACSDYVYDPDMELQLEAQRCAMRPPLSLSLSLSTIKHLPSSISLCLSLSVCLSVSVSVSVCLSLSV
jgi:hypothetical protein